MEDARNMISIDNHTKSYVSILFVVFFFFSFYCTSETSLIADDYAYMFDFSTGWGSPNPQGIYPPPSGCERIHSVFQILQSMSAHRSCMNGRVFSHGLVQFFLMFPKTVFNIVNALMYTAEMGLIALTPSIVLKRKCSKYAPGFLAFTFSCIWFFQLSFGEVNLWLDGAINYLWGSVLGLLYIGSYLTLLYNKIDFGCIGRNVAVLILSYIAGAYNESLSCTLIVFSLFTILYLRVTKHYISLFVYLSFLFTVFGFIFLLSAPATMANKIHNSSVLAAISNVFNTIPVLLRIGRRTIVLFFLSILLLLYAIIKQVNRDYIVISLVLLLSALVCFLSLSLASDVPPRALFFIPVLLCLDCTWLMTFIFEKDNNRIFLLTARTISLVLLCELICFSIPKGISDIHKVHILTDLNEEKLLRSKRLGESVAVIQDIPRKGLSSYVALEGLNYIDHNPQLWPNVYMAKYYGVDEIQAAN